MQKMPNEFINYFTNIADKLISELPSSNTNATSYLSNRIQNSFLMSQLVKKEIESAITGLKNNGKGVNNISTLVLKECKSVLSDILVFIFNLCVSQGYFPSELKTGCITPIHKSGSKNCINNYRPVCSLSPFSKIFERVIYNRMIEYIENNNIFSNTQYGFRKGLSTENALVHFIDEVHKGLQNREYTVAVFMDLSKAFDVLNHDILLKKMEHYGFRGTFLNLIRSFITDRKYFVSANGTKSDTKTVNNGVPQGSTLGPLLFLIYVNDMSNSSDIFNFIQFADDTTASHRGKNRNAVIQTVKNELEKVLEWLTANKLIINLLKTHIMLFTNKRGDRTIPIIVRNTELEQKDDCKFLGVYIDKDLNWKNHIKYITSKVSKNVALLGRLKHTFPKTILKTLYATLILPYFNYCNLIWGAADKTCIQNLVVLQKKAVRVISKVNYMEHTDPLFKAHKILNLVNTYKFNCLIFIYKLVKLNVYPEIKKQVLRNSAYHNHMTRYRSQYRLPGTRLKCIKQSCLYIGLSLWNKFEANITICKNIHNFKTHMKELLLNQ